MSLDALGEVAKIFGVGGAVAFVLAAAAVTAAKVLRADKTLAGVLDRIEQERDYYRNLVTTERAEAARERAELRALLEQADTDARRERAALTAQNDILIGQLEDLRRTLTRYTLKEQT